MKKSENYLALLHLVCTQLIFAWLAVFGEVFIRATRTAIVAQGHPYLSLE